MVNARTFKPLPLYLAPLKTLLVGISGAERIDSKPLTHAKICFVKMLLGISGTL